MFKLVTIEDTIVVPSRFFGVPRVQAIEHMVNKMMSDRVIPGVGLVIALWDVLSLGNDRLARHSGTSTTDVRFRVVVFAPFIGETIATRIGPSTESGILTYMHFFNLIWVPRDALPRRCSFDEDDHVWAWRPSVNDDDEDGEEDEEDEDDEEVEKADVVSNYMDGGNESVVRVTAVDYDEGGVGNYGSHGTSATAAATTTNGNADVAPDENGEAGNGATTKTQYSMVIKASMYDEVLKDNQGLGDPAWWYEGEEEEELAEDEEGGEGEGEGFGQDGGRERIEQDEETGDGTAGGDEGYGEGGEEWDENAQHAEDFVVEERGVVAVDAEEADD